MRRTGVKQYSSNLVANEKCTFDHIPCCLSVLMRDHEDLPYCLGPLLLALLSMVPLVTPTLVVLPSWLLLWSARLLLGTILLLRWLGCWSNLTYGLSSNWSWGSRRCGQLKHRGLLLVEGAMPRNMPGVATIITRAMRAVLLSLWVLCCLARWPMSPILLLHWALLSRWSGPNPLLLVHGLDPLEMLLGPIGLPHSILVRNVINTRHVQLNISSKSLDEPSDSLRLWCDKGLGKSGELGERCSY